MKILRCLIVDDEELARTLLEDYVSKAPNLELVAKCKNPLEAMTVLQKEAIDLIFLDIQMPELTGVEFLKTLSNRPMVIFTTAYADYALEGYALDVVDYLLKPFGLDRFLQAVNKAIARSPVSSAPVTTPAVNKNYLLVKSEHKVYKLAYDQIQYIQSMREYLAYYTTDGRILSLGSLKGLEEILPANDFIRIHKSFIVPIQKIKTLEGNLLHVGQEKLPIGASYKEAVLAKVF